MKYRHVLFSVVFSVVLVWLTSLYGIQLKEKKTLFTSRYFLCRKAIAVIKNVEALTFGQDARYFPSTDTSSTWSSFAGLDELEVKKI